MPTCPVPAEHPIRESIPVSVVLPIIHRYLDEYETPLRKNNTRGTGAISILAKDAGFTTSTFMSMLTRRDTLSFDTVDRVLCAMDQPWLWHEWPLLVFYYSAEPPLVCVIEGCENEFSPMHGYRNVNTCPEHRRKRASSRDRAEYMRGYRRVAA